MSTLIATATPMKQQRENKKAKNSLTMIKGLVLDLHSTRYVCHNCQLATIGMQAESQLPPIKHIRELISNDEVLKVKFSCRNTLPLKTRVTADLRGGRKFVKRNEHQPHEKISFFKKINSTRFISKDTDLDGKTEYYIPFASGTVAENRNVELSTHLNYIKPF